MSLRQRAAEIQYSQHKRISTILYRFIYTAMQLMARIWPSCANLWSNWKFWTVN